MKARYFYETLVNHRKQIDDPNPIRCTHYDYGNTEIHHKGEYMRWYFISINGEVSEQNLFGCANDDLTIDDLEGDDFELFSSEPIYKAGYIKFEDTVTIRDVQERITELYYQVEYPDLDWGVNVKDSVKSTKYLTESGFEYEFSELRIELELIKDFVADNRGRKHYGLKYIPFDPNMTSTNSVHVLLREDICNARSNREIYNSCNKAIAYLEKQMKLADVQGTWVETYFRKPIYV